MDEIRRVWSIFKSIVAVLLFLLGKCDLFLKVEHAIVFMKMIVVGKGARLLMEKGSGERQHNLSPGRRYVGDHQFGK